MPFPRATGCQKYQFQYFTDDALTSSGFSIPSATESLLLKVHNYVLQCSELHSPHPISSLGFAHLVPPLPRLSGVFSPLCLASPLPGPLAVSASWTAHAQHLASQLPVLGAQPCGLSPSAPEHLQGIHHGAHYPKKWTTASSLPLARQKTFTGHMLRAHHTHGLQHQEGTATLRVTSPRVYEGHWTCKEDFCNDSYSSIYRLL